MCKLFYLNHSLIPFVQPHIVIVWFLNVVKV